MKDMLLYNAAEIATPTGTSARHGQCMNEIRIIKDGAIFIHDGKIADIGESGALERRYQTADCEKIDAAGKSVVPGFVDAHTHFLFGGYREEEFLMRLSGQDYLSIMASGGGIANTVEKTRALSTDELVTLGKQRLRSILSMGVTTVEGKSGYGLDLDTELNMLRAQKRLNAEQPVEIAATFLGAHDVPREYKNNSDGYIDFLIGTVLPKVRADDLAEFCDVFCETGVFSLAQSEKLLLAAKTLGFGLKIHADEMTDLGGSALAARLGAVSAEHLLMASQKSIGALSSSETVATLLPATAFCLNKPFAPGRRMIDAGCAVALASDFNPGSCFTNSIPLILALACINMHLTMEEALTAVTLNGAAAIRRAQTKGSIEIGKDGDVCILAFPSYKFLVYHTAVNIVETVIKNGRVAYSEAR
jgi:imidazolonepropionase